MVGFGEIGYLASVEDCINVVGWLEVLFEPP